MRALPSIEVRIYTRKGDDGTTGLLYGGRVPKDHSAIELNGAVDEAQASLGMARAEAGDGSELDGLLIDLERELYVLMAEVATAPENRSKLVPERSMVTTGMVDALEARIDALSERFEMPTEFVLPGQNRRAAALDFARTKVRGAERVARSARLKETEVGRYLNRLSDLLWTMARWQEGDEHVPARRGPKGRRGARGSQSGGAGP